MLWERRDPAFQCEDAVLGLSCTSLLFPNPSVTPVLCSELVREEEKIRQKSQVLENRSAPPSTGNRPPARTCKSVRTPSETRPDGVTRKGACVASTLHASFPALISGHVLTG